MHATDANQERPADQSVSANPCTHDACQPNMVSTTAKSSAASPQHSATASIFPLVQPLASHARRFSEREYPPPKTASLDPISISLRI
jgi:hypothetical protein